MISTTISTPLPIIKRKTSDNKYPKPALGCRLYNMQLQKEVKSNPKQPSCKKFAALRSHGEKRCEIKVAMMVG